MTFEDGQFVSASAHAGGERVRVKHQGRREGRAHAARVPSRQRAETGAPSTLNPQTQTQVPKP